MGGAGTLEQSYRDLLVKRAPRLKPSTVVATMNNGQVREIEVNGRVTVSEGGDAESQKELKDGFATTMATGLLMVYAVLVLLFGTFLQPITILFSLPLSIGGAIGALLLTGKQLTIPVWIGILMLMGIVTKNAIMLVEFAIESWK